MLRAMAAKEGDYRHEIAVLKRNLACCSNECRRLEDDKRGLTQQVLELGRVEEGATDHALK